MQPHDGPNLLVVIVLVVVVVTIAVIAARVIVRARYARRVREQGFEIGRDGSPVPAYGLDQPPFGIGTAREVPMCITGRVARGEFRAFEYRTNKAYVPGLVVTMPLSHNFPALSLDATFTPTCADPAFADAVMPRLGPHLQGLRTMTTQDHGPDVFHLGIDHRFLVLVGAPHDPTQLKAVAEALAAVAAQLDDPALQRFTGTTVPPEMGVTGCPGWIYRRRDDSALDLVRFTRSGHNHRAVDVVFGPGLVKVVALTHTWDTTRTVTTTNSDGSTSTHTETDHHAEYLLEFQPQFRFAELKVNEGWFGNKRQFESSDFNDRFTVRMPDARMASDVFHPRMMRWLMQLNPPPFRVRDDGVFEIDVADRTDVAAMAWGVWFVEQFLGRVPDFVYANLGFRGRPIPAVDQVES